MVRRIFLLFSGIFLMVCMASNSTCHALECNVSATSAIVMDVQSGRVLFEKEAHRQMLIASTTKIMTALLAIEQGGLQEPVTVQREWTLVEGSSMYLKEGETLTLESLLYGLLLCSGNDAALAVAAHCGGTVEAFVEQMNAKAQALGMKNTSFANPNGLDHRQHYATAADMALLAAYAMENETFARLVSTQSITVGGRTMTNHNKLLSRTDGCIGLKTGYTRAAGRTLVTCCEREGQRLVAVTLQAPNDWEDHSALYDAAFAAYPNREVVAVGETAQTLRVNRGTIHRVPVLFADTFTYPLAAGEKPQVTLHLPQTAAAPFGAGDHAGEAVVTLDGRELGRIPLRYGASAGILPDETELPLLQRLLALLNEQ